MQINKTDVAVKSMAMAGAIGIAVAAPHLALFLVPSMAPLFKEIGKVGVDVIKGVGTEALWGLREGFSPTHENLTRLLGEAYSAAIEDVLKQNADNDLIRYILPSIKEEVDKHLATQKEADLFKLFPTEQNLLAIKIDGQKKMPFYKRLLGKGTIEYKLVADDLLANVKPEDFILKLSDDRETAKKLLSEEVEITLRRWFVQLNPTLANEFTFPPSLDKTVFKQIGELIPQKINELVTRDDLNLSWIAFQRSHLQAILEQVNNLQNGLSENDRKLLRPLGEFLHKLSENNELIKNLADGTTAILARVGESEENIKNCIAEERKKFSDWLEPRLDEILSV